MKKISLVLALLLMMSFVLCACGSNELVGKWANSNGYSIEFNDDGTGTVADNSVSIDFTYEIDGNNVKVIPPAEMEGLDTQIHPFVIVGDTLELDGETLTRQ